MRRSARAAARDPRRGLGRGAAPHLALRLKLAARDVLLDREEGAGSRAAGGELLRAVAALLLAGCVIVAAFALGVAFERGRPDALPVAEGPGLVAIPSPPARVPAGSGEGASSVTRDPATGAAWQRVLLEAARDHLRAGEAAKARSFFLRSAAMAPRSALATAARLGAAEALLAQGRRPEAREELERLRREVRGGVQPGDAAQLQQISELLQQE